jgi:plastocyanin
MIRLTNTLGSLVLAGLLALVLGACSGASANPGAGSPASSGSPSGAPTGDAVTVTASNIAFNPTQISVPADKAFDLVFDNREGVPHNVAIYTDSGASTKVSVGEIFSGPGQKTQTVPALAAGTYFFRCDVHPNMQGTLVAE